MNRRPASQQSPMSATQPIQQVAAPDVSWLHDPQHRTLSWMYLRRVCEASRAEVLEALWPEGWWDHNDNPGRVVELATAIAHRQSTSPGVLDLTEQRYRADPRADAGLAQTRGWRLLTPDSEEWPASLTEAFVRMTEGGQADDTVRGQAEFPFALWVCGKPRLDTVIEHSLTMVGTRAPTRYGEEVCGLLAGGMASQGYTLISGAAVGVDTLVHRCALDRGVPTVAILACGLDVAYPKKNTQLLKDIVVRGGLLISEYAPGTHPARHRFLTRNRLAAALGQATLVVEAPHRSGALNTLNWAEGMGKPTLAVPGPITTVNSQGCLDRIATGRAQLIRNVDDIRTSIEPLGVQMELGVGSPRGSDSTAVSTAGRSSQQDPRAEIVSWQHVAVFDAAGTRRDHTGTLADIQGETGMDARLIITIARELEKKGAVRREGERWIKVPGVRL